MINFSGLMMENFLNYEVEEKIIMVLFLISYYKD